MRLPNRIMHSFKYVPCACRVVGCVVRVVSGCVRVRISLTSYTVRFGKRDKHYSKISFDGSYPINNNSETDS